MGSNELLTAEFDLSITPKEYLKYYQKRVNWVVVMSTKGLSIRFPANLLSAYITHEGIHGRFILKYSKSGKVSSLNKQLVSQD